MNNDKILYMRTCTYRCFLFVASSLIGGERRGGRAPAISRRHSSSSFLHMTSSANAEKDVHASLVATMASIISTRLKIVSPSLSLNCSLCVSHILQNLSVCVTSSSPASQKSQAADSLFPMRHRNLPKQPYPVNNCVK